MSRLRLSVIVAAALYASAIVLCYAWIVAPGFGGFRTYALMRPESHYVLLNFAISVVPALWMPISVRRPTQILCWTIYLLVYVPSCTLPLFSLTMDPASVSVLSASLMVGFGILNSIYRLPLLEVGRMKVKPMLFWMFVWIFFLAVCAWLIRIFGLNLVLPSWFDVYDVRSDYRIQLLANPRASVAIRWVMYVIAPLFIGWGIVRKSAGPLLAGLFAMLFIYSTTGHKTSLLLFPLTLGMAWMLRQKGRNFGLWIVWGAVLLVVTAMALDLAAGRGLFSFTVVRRAILTPGLLTGYYYEYFSQNEFFLLRHMRVGKLMFGELYDYTTTQPFIIGRVYGGNAEMSANANFWGDAYSNFGLPGILAFSAILGGVFHLYDSIAASGDYWLTRLLLVGPIVTFANSALVTVLIGHGFLFALLIAYTVPDPKPEQSWTGRTAGDQ